MNLDPTRLPLPQPPSSRMHRRRRVHGLYLDRTHLQQFARTAESLHTAQATPDADAIASTARALFAQFHGYRQAPPVRLRMRCFAALRMMSAEPGWPIPEEERDRIECIARYASRGDRLIPHAVPVIGGLDDALLLDMVWPEIRNGVESYLDFRHVRAQEAYRQGLSQRSLRFTREDWLQIREERRAWRSHQRTHGLVHYTQDLVTPRFRVF